MQKDIVFITIEEAASKFNRSQKQIRRIVEECTNGVKNKDSTWRVFPDPDFAHREPLDKGYGFRWQINLEKMRLHFEEKMKRQMERIESTKSSTLNSATVSNTNVREKPQQEAATEKKTEDKEPLQEQTTKENSPQLLDHLIKQLEVKDQQLAAVNQHVSSLISNLEDSKKRSDSLQLLLVNLAGKTGFEVKQLETGSIEIIETKTKRPVEHEEKKQKKWYKPWSW